MERDEGVMLVNRDNQLKREAEKNLVSGKKTQQAQYKEVLTAQALQKFMDMTNEDSGHKEFAL